MRGNKTLSMMLTILLTTIFLCSGSFFKAEAAGIIRVVPNDVLAGSDRDLGLLIFEMPAGAIKAGDTFIMSLPENFYFNHSVPVAVGDDISSQVPSTVNVVYPPSVSGSPNSITGNITADYPDRDKLRVALTTDPDLTKKSFLYVYLKGITVPSGYEGEVEIDITTNGGWPTSIEGLNTGEGSNNSQDDNRKEPQKPDKDNNTTPPAKISAVFKIGEPSFSANSKIITMDAAPFIKNGRTFVPIRYIANAVGITDENISYQSGEVIIKYRDTTIALKPGSDVMSAGGRNIKMDVPVLLENGRTYLPIRWVCEALKLKVTWVAESQSVLVESQ